MTTVNPITLDRFLRLIMMVSATVFVKFWYLKVEKTDGGSKWVNDM